jgi:hypothetical protein
MKQCAHCKEEKPDSEFAWNNKLLGRRQKHCRACMKMFNRQSYERRDEKRKREVQENRKRRVMEVQQYVWDYLSVHPCVRCGESDPRVLEFVHIKGNKFQSISKMISDGHTIRSVKKEIAKCQVLCANCHRKKTIKERGWFTG